MADIQLRLSVIKVNLKDGSTLNARAEGNIAAWLCPCGESLPLVGRCYFQFGHDCHTICPNCKRKYRVHKDKQKRSASVEEE